MSLLEKIKLLTGKRTPGRLDAPQSATGSVCPHEADLLAYSQDRLPDQRREQLEMHFLDCDDCRDFLVLFARTSDDAVEHDTTPLNDKAIKEQTAKILTYIKEDEFNSRRAKRDKQPVLSGAGLFGSTRRLAAIGFMIAALAVGAVYFLTKGEPENAVAMKAVALATKDMRRIEPRISGDLPYSPYPLVTRGAAEVEDPQANLQLDRAQSQVQYAEDGSAPAKDRLVLARVYLARGEADYTRRALAILEQLVAAPDPSPDVLNDTGVALFQLKRYEEAINYFNRALGKAPAFDEALFNLSLAEQKAGNVEKARKDWGRFIEATADEKWKEEARRRMR